MEYKTKFALGDVVYYGKPNEIHKSIVKEINLSKYDKKTLCIVYILSDNAGFEESYLMTKEEAIKCL